MFSNIKKQSRRAFAAAALMLVTTAGSADATLVYELGTPFSGYTAIPTSPDPWARLTISDHAEANKVTVQMESLLYSNEFIGSWYFNFHDEGQGADALSLQASNFQVTQGSLLLPPTVTYGEDNKKHKDDGVGGYYDIKVEFAPPPGGSSSELFDGTDILTFDLEWTGAIDPSDFDFYSIIKNGKNFGLSDFHTAIHIQGLAGGQSVWVGDGVIPEPGTYLLMGSMLAMGMFMHRRRSSNLAA